MLISHMPSVAFTFVAFTNSLDPYPTTVSGADPAFLERGLKCTATYIGTGMYKGMVEGGFVC